MSLASLFSPIDGPENWESFWFANQDSHEKIRERIFSLTSIDLARYLIYPVTEEGFEIFEQVHQQAHNEMNLLLGTGGNDFTGLDLKSPDAVAAYIQIHGQNHRQVEDILRIT